MSEYSNCLTKYFNSFGKSQPTLESAVEDIYKKLEASSIDIAEMEGLSCLKELPCKALIINITTVINS